jgi:hypothetical protein
MTVLFLGGGEKGSHRSILLNAGVDRIAMNLTHFPIPKRKELVLSDLFQGADICLYTSENDEQVDVFDQFVRDNADDLSIVIGRPDYNGAWLEQKYIPIWNDAEDIERLEYLTQHRKRVAVSDKAVNATTIKRIRQLAQRWETEMLILSSKTEVLGLYEWDYAVVTSWTSAIRYGETQVWDGHALRRYPAQQKDTARRSHASDIIRLGIDIDAIHDDDANERALLAVRSWQAWESDGAYDPQDPPPWSPEATDDSDEIITISPQTHNPPTEDSGTSSIIITPLNEGHERPKVLLPVIGIDALASTVQETDPDLGEYDTGERVEYTVIRHTDESLRQCDNCYLASRCPAFQPHSSCAYKIPVEIKSREQLNAAMRALVEMQVSRVLFARFAEELEGQGIDPLLSKELDRVFALVEKMKDISDTRDVLRFEMEARSSSGVLSRLFGARAGEQARQLSEPLPPQQLDSFYERVIDVEDS